MNIFVTSNSPQQSALWLDDKRVNKMVLETAQLLCTAVILRGGQAPYKITHMNHPCARWARTNRSNFYWLVSHGRSLADTYKLAYGKTHASLSVIEECAKEVDLMPIGNRTQFANCTPFLNAPAVFLAYRKYLSQKWDEDAHPTWRNRESPDWYNVKMGGN